MVSSRKRHRVSTPTGIPIAAYSCGDPILRCASGTSSIGTHHDNDDGHGYGYAASSTSAAGQVSDDNDSQTHCPTHNGYSATSDAPPTTMSAAAAAGSTSVSTCATHRGSDNQFPGKLHDMLDHLEEKGLTSIASWNAAGDAFLVHDTDRLVEILPKFYSQTKYRSFQRQLNMWNFSRGSGNRSKRKRIFSHPYFLRGRKDMCKQMSRHMFKTTTSHARIVTTDGDPALTTTNSTTTSTTDATTVTAEEGDIVLLGSESHDMSRSMAEQRQDSHGMAPVHPYSYSYSHSRAASSTKPWPPAPAEPTNTSNDSISHDDDSFEKILLNIADGTDIYDGEYSRAMRHHRRASEGRRYSAPSHPKSREHGQGDEYSYRPWSYRSPPHNYVPSSQRHHSLHERSRYDEQYSKRFRSDTDARRYQSLRRTEVKDGDRVKFEGRTFYYMDISDKTTSRMRSR